MKRRHDEQSEVGQLGVAEQDDLLREHQAAHRRVEGRRDAGAGARRDQHFRAFRSELSNCATAEPMAPPTCAMGPSRPTDHPEPSESGSARSLDENPSALDARVTEIHLLEKIREPVAEHVAAKDAVKQQHPDGAGRQHERNRNAGKCRRAQFAAGPFEIQKTQPATKRMSARNPRLPSAASMPTIAASKIICT